MKHPFDDASDEASTEERPGAAQAECGVAGERNEPSYRAVPDSGGHDAERQ
jgi:hypothetical protein